MPARAIEIARAAGQRLSASPFYDPNDTYDVFLCDTPALFALFALWDHGVGGVSQVYLTGHVFLRPAHIDRDRLVGPSGNEASGDRTLTYFLAHELTHTATARRLGRWHYFRLARWQQEGYADYVAKGEHSDRSTSTPRFAIFARERRISIRLDRACICGTICSSRTCSTTPA